MQSSDRGCFGKGLANTLCSASKSTAIDFKMKRMRRRLSTCMYHIPCKKQIDALSKCGNPFSSNSRIGVAFFCSITLFPILKMKRMKRHLNVCIICHVKIKLTHYRNVEILRLRLRCQHLELELLSFAQHQLFSLASASLHVWMLMCP
jgi:hypothetical protein